MKVGGYVLGEFGHLIADNEGSGPKSQLELLHSKFPNCSLQTKALLLSTYVKFANLYPEIIESIRPIFKTQQASLDVEIQQRATEYYKLTQGNPELLVSYHYNRNNLIIPW